MEFRKTQKEIYVLTQNIRILRKKHSLTKQEMARILKIGTGSLRKLENGELPQKLSVEVLFEIQRYFGISPYNMFSQVLSEDDHK